MKVSKTTKERAAPATDRRGFLKFLGTGAVTGAAAAGAVVTGAEAAPKEADKDTLYRETEHVKTYYDLAKF